MFSVFGSAGFHPSKRRYNKQERNKNLGVSVQVQLEDLLREEKKTISVKHTDGTRHIVEIAIPLGVNNGTKIKYSGLGDWANKKVAPGDLTVTIEVAEHEKFRREKNYLFMDFTISAWDAIIGSVVNVSTIENRLLNINIPAGTQYGTSFKVPGHGLPDKNNNRGDMFVNIFVKTPENLTEEQLNICKKLRDSK